MKKKILHKIACINNETRFLTTNFHTGSRMRQNADGRQIWSGYQSSRFGENVQDVVCSIPEASQHRGQFVFSCYNNNLIVISC